MGTDGGAEAGAAGSGGRTGTTDRLLLSFLEASGALVTHLPAIIPHLQRATSNPCNQICPLKAEIAARQGWWANYRKMRAMPTSSRPPGQPPSPQFGGTMSPLAGAFSWVWSCERPWPLSLCSEILFQPQAWGLGSNLGGLPPWEERKQFKVTSHFHREDKTGRLLTPGTPRAWLISRSGQSQSNISDL